jgi:uncharacterized membrane protein
MWEQCAATYREFLEPFLHFSIDGIALLVHNLGKLRIHVAKRFEDAGAAVECIACLAMSVTARFTIGL